MTRIAVLGATGRTGREILGQALAKGLEISALARQQEKLGDFQNKTKVFQGDAADPMAVERVVEGSDAVLSALGLVHGSPKGLMTTSSSNMVAALRSKGTRRLVILTNTGVPDPSDRPPVTQRVLRFVLRKMNAPLWYDSIEAARVVAESDLDWTLVRAPILTDKPRTGMYRAGPLAHHVPLRVSRADVAEFMLACAMEGKFVREKPVIAG